MSVHALLPTPGIRITAVGFGAWAIGGGDWSFAWGAQKDADSIAAIRHALDSFPVSAASPSKI